MKQLEVEFKELGFAFINETTVEGRVPFTEDINGFYIWVQINLSGYPVNQPSIKLVSICDDKELYKAIPPHWRHVDEFILEMDPTSSSFYICCLHNWSAKPEYNAKFIYGRIYDWLCSNVNGQWDEEDDLPTWRILPQFSDSFIFLDKEFLDQLYKLEPKKIHKIEVAHSYYTFNSGKNSASGSKKGNDYPLNDIDFTFKQGTEFYYFFPKTNGVLFKLRLMKLKKDYLTSDVAVVKIPRYSFKTFYQLLRSLQDNLDLKDIPKYKNLPFIVIYRGEKGNKEIVSFIVDENFLKGKKIFSVKILQVQTVPNRPIHIDLKVGLIGVGSLGSQVARLLTDKGTKEILISDPDWLEAYNLGNHELTGIYLGEKKSKALENQLLWRSLKTKITAVDNDVSVAANADILVVTVGNKQSFDRLAFQQLLNYKKPIIWAWTSPLNILQEIVITTPYTGCLNCYYETIKTNKKLNHIQQMAKKELGKYSNFEIDLCSNPHTISSWERMVFLSTQIVSILAYYSKNKKFKFDFVNYYWGMEDVFAQPLTGYLEQHKSCFCRGEIR